MNSGIYQIVNLLNGKMYVGSTKDFEKRKKVHFVLLIKNKHFNIKLQRAFNKYGESVFEFRILETCPYEKAIILEKEDYYINTLNSKRNGYNIGNATFGDCLSEHPNKIEIIKKISSTLKKNNSLLTSEERKKKFGKCGDRNGSYGKRRPRHVINALIEANKKYKELHGHGPSKGIPKSEEHRTKLSELAKLRIGPLNSFYGKTHSEETKAKISAKNKGKECKTLHPFFINGIRYEKLKDAETATGIKGSTIAFRCKSPNLKFKEYFYVDNPNKE